MPFPEQRELSWDKFHAGVHTLSAVLNLRRTKHLKHHPKIVGQLRWLHQLLSHCVPVSCGCRHQIIPFFHPVMASERDTPMDKSMDLPMDLTRPCGLGARHADRETSRRQPHSFRHHTLNIIHSHAAPYGDQNGPCNDTCIVIPLNVHDKQRKRQKN